MATVVFAPSCTPRESAPASEPAGRRAAAETPPASEPADRTAAADPPPAASDPPLPACVWCGAGEAPEELGWDLRIAPADEPGEPLVIEGRVRHADGRPASDVVLYLYHTNSQGRYATRGDERGNGRRHGYLRGWLEPDREGRYRITTIRPAPYPNRTEPAHIHVTVLAPGAPEYWLDGFVFAGDPLLPTHLARARDIGGSGVVELVRDERGGWRGRRDITLPATPPGAP